MVCAAPPRIQPGSWTLVILPDTQYYTKRNHDVFYGQMQFIADHKTALSIKYVLHEGDITQQGTKSQWGVAAKALRTLEDAGIDYSLLPGNHDYASDAATRSCNMAKYFPVSRLKQQPTFGGVYPGEPDSPHNSYSLFRAGGIDWLVIALEFGPRDAIVDWADRVLKAHPRRQAMIVTHSYLYFDGKRMDWAAFGTSQEGNPHSYAVANLTGGVNDGEEMWQKLKDNPNLKLVFNGHTTEKGKVKGIGAYLASAADDGHVVHQMLANYQAMLPTKGEGYLRLMEFQTDGKVHVRTYSPYRDASLRTPDQDFVFTLAKPSPVGRFRYRFRRPQRYRRGPLTLRCCLASR